ncbi:MAG: hypothetical protein NVSMB59_13070 [Vulcanimicrobiaceae bacterium]
MYHGGLRTSVVEAIRKSGNANPEMSPSIDNDPRFVGNFPGKAYIGVPLVHEGDVLGFVESYRERPIAFGEAAELASYAQSIAGTLHAARTRPNSRLETRGRILIAEDDPSTRLLLRGILRKENFDVIDVADGQAACVEALRERPDLILIDWVMPIMDGREATRVLKADARTASVPIVMLTAQNEIDEKVLALEAGVQDFLNKPVDPRELVARIEQQLRWRNLLASDTIEPAVNAPPQKASDPLPPIEPGGDLWLRGMEAAQVGKFREAVAFNIAEAERCDSTKEYARAALAYRNASQLAGKVGNADLADKCLRLAGKMYLFTGETNADPKTIKDAYLNASRCFIIAGNVKLAKKAIDIAQSMENILADDRPSALV